MGHPVADLKTQLTKTGRVYIFVREGILISRTLSSIRIFNEEKWQDRTFLNEKWGRGLGGIVTFPNQINTSLTLQQAREIV